MILYYALTVYHQLECVLHKMLFKPNESAHLYLSSSILFEDGQIQRLKECGLFDKVVIMHDDKAWGIGSKVKFNTQDRLDSALEEIDKLCSQSLLMPLKDYDELYNCADHFPLGFVMAYRKIPYYYFEEATGAHSRRDILKEEIKHKNQFWYLMFEKYGVRGMADCIIEKYIDFDFQLPNFHDEKARDFSVRKLLKQLNQEQLEKVLSIFGMFSLDDLPKDQGLALILTQHYCAASITTFEGQKLLYALLQDYFCDGLYCVIKPHPTDRQGVYGEWYQNVSIINRELPAELLPFCFDKKLALTLSATSSSAYNLTDISDRVITFESQDNRFDKLFYSMHKYYVTCELIKQQEIDTIVSIGADTRQIENFLNTDDAGKYHVIEIYDKWEFPSSPKIIVVDVLSLLKISVTPAMMIDFMNSLGDEDLMIFIDSYHDVVFYPSEDNSFFDRLVPIAINKKALNENALEETGKEWIFIYSNYAKKNYEFLSVKIEKILQNTGITISSGLSMEADSVKEHLLEAMLYATEKKCIKMSAEINQLKKK